MISIRRYKLTATYRFTVSPANRMKCLYSKSSIENHGIVQSKQ